MRDVVPGGNDRPEIAPGPAAVIDDIEGLICSALGQNGPFLVIGDQPHSAEVFGSVPGVNVGGEVKGLLELGLDAGVNGHAEGDAHGGFFDGADDKAGASNSPVSVVVFAPLGKDVLLREVEVMVIYAGSVLHHWDSSRAKMERIVFASCLEKEAFRDDRSDGQCPKEILKKPN